jgi:hypothetical protein
LFIAQAYFDPTWKRSYMEEKAEIRTLPIEGLVLSEFTVAGNGRDAEMRVRTRDGRLFVFGVNESCRLRIAVRGAVLTEITGPYDTTLIVRYTAAHLVLGEARMHYPGSAEEWTEDMDRLSRGWRMIWRIKDGSFTLLGEACT